jgi:hypothetical protein
MFILSGNCCTCFGWYPPHHQERKQLYLQHLVFVRPLRLPAAIVEKMELSSNSSTIAADNTSGVTNTRCCRHSCTCSWRWLVVPPEICTAFSRYNKLYNVASCWIYIGIFLWCTDPWTLNNRHIFPIWNIRKWNVDKCNIS